MCLIWVCLLNAAYFLCCQLKNWHWACGPTLVYIKYYIFSMYNCLGLQIAIDPRTINLIGPEPNSSKHLASVKPSRVACFFIFTPPRISRTNPLFGLATSDSAHCHQTQQRVDPTLFLFFANGSHLHASSSISVDGLPLSHQRCSWINDIGLKPNLHQRIKHSPLPFNSPMCIQSEDRCG